MDTWSHNLYNHVKVKAHTPKSVMNKKILKPIKFVINWHLEKGTNPYDIAK